jgi:hypothetical protein
MARTSALWVPDPSASLGLFQAQVPDATILRVPPKDRDSAEYAFIQDLKIASDWLASHRAA